MSGPGGKPAGGAVLFRGNAQNTLNQSVMDMEDAFQSSPNLHQLSLADEAFPVRPAYGAAGNRALVFTNYVELSLNPAQTLRKFSIIVEPPATGRKLHRVIQLLLREEGLRGIPHFTDYKSTMILREDGDNRKFNVRYFDEDQQGPDANTTVYHVKLQQTDVLSVAQFYRYLDPREGITYKDKDAMVQTLNTMLYHYSRSSADVVAVGKKTFPLSGVACEVTELGGGLQAMRGFFASARVATGRVLVNVNVAYGLFYKPGSLAGLIASSGIRDKHKLEKFLKFLRVRKTHLSTTDLAGERVAPIRTIFGLASPGDGRRQNQPEGGASRAPRVKEFGANSREVQFWFEERKQFISVYDFFTSVKGMKLENPNLPVINLGSKLRPVYVPAELCDVPRGQNAPMRRVTLSKEQSTKMLNASVRKPAENFQLISDHGIQAVGLSSKNGLLLDSQNVRVNPALLSVTARFLGAPSISYKQVLRPGPSWNLRGQKFSLAGEIKSWGWIYVQVQGHRPWFRDVQNFNQLLGEFRKALAATGIKLAAEPVHGHKFSLQGQDDPALEVALRKVPRDVDLLWVIVPEHVDLLYDRIKYLGDVRLGLTTVVSVEAKVAKSGGLAQYLGNEALKINLKLGGRNQLVNPAHLYFIAAGDTMLVGIDVTHPSTDPSKGGAPSVASMVASVDKYLAQWPAVLSVQKKRQEMVSDLSQMLRSRLEMWKTSNGSYPRRIVVYRDGVSEGQYQMVKEQELPMLQHACRGAYSEEGSGLPQITIIIVAKRHHTRFAPRTGQDADATSNCRAGLVVDRTITDSRMWTFFLQAHAAIKGSARPGFYTVVHDEVFRAAAGPRGLNAADVCQDLTQGLCYAFGRATRAVGVATPAYYADIVCTRAASYLRAYECAAAPASEGGLSRASGGGSDEIGQGRRDDLQAAVATHERLRKTMFYI